MILLAGVVAALATCDLDAPCACPEGADTAVGGPEGTLNDLYPRRDGEPRGIYLLTTWTRDANWEVADSPFVDGVTLRRYWKDYQPAEATYALGDIDAHLDRALALTNARKRFGVRLMVGTGFYAPTWLLAESAGDDDTRCAPGTSTTSLVGVDMVCVKVDQGPYQGEHHWWPIPWDPDYRALQRGFFRRLAEHLDAYEQAHQRTIDWISVTGVNSHNGETSHPRDVPWHRVKRPNGERFSCGSAAARDYGACEVAVRRALQGEWTRQITFFDEVFGGRGIHYTLAPIFDALRVAGGGNQGEDWELKLALKKHGTQAAHSAYFGIQTNGLDAQATWSTCTDPGEKFGVGKPKRHWRQVQNRARTRFAGFQTRAPDNLYANTTGRFPECDRARIWATLAENVKAVGVDVLEVYKEDVEHASTLERTMTCGEPMRTQKGWMVEIHRWLTE